MMDDRRKIPSPLLSMVPVAALVGLLFLVLKLFDGDTLSGASQIVLILSTAVCIAVAMIFRLARWRDIERAIVGNISNVTPALLILLLIGALSGAWMVSGIIPTLIYYGMMIISPDMYLASTCVICAAVSVMTGSSWTTVATVGIALAGIGTAQGFSPGWIGGAIISGAYFGDKISPLSDTTVMASAITDTPLFTHIRYMMVTTVPSIAIALAVFTVAGFRHSAASPEGISVFADTLKGTFNISLWLLLVPAATALLIVRKAPPMATLFVSGILAAAFAVIFQPHVLRAIADGDSTGAAVLVKGFFISLYGSTHVSTGHATIDSLVATRGMAGMMNTIWLILCAMCFGGAMTASGMLGSIVSVFARFMRNTAGTVATTVFSGIFFNVCTGDQYLSIILTGDIYRDIYRSKGYESRLLSRSAEDGATVTSPLVPWNTCGMTQATVLGISTLTYLPYCIFNLVSPLMSILVAATGYKIRREILQ